MKKIKRLETGGTICTVHALDLDKLEQQNCKLLEILTLAVCNFGTSYYGKVYNTAVKIIQKENPNKTWEEIKAEGRRIT